jgi:hypothetical protein
MDSFIKKIVTVEELEKLSKDIEEFHLKDNENYTHALGLKHDVELITKSLSHESLLIWNIHVWGHFNGEKWDGIFIGFIRKSEKFNKKFMDEYLWLAKNSNSGMKLYFTAEKYARQQGCEYLAMNVIENHPLKENVKTLYKRLGFQKDTETFFKRL